MGTFVIDLVPLKCQDSVLKKLINKNFRELIDSGLEPYSYPLSEPEYTGRELFNSLAEFIYTDDSSPLYSKNTYEEIQGFMMACGVTPEHIVEWLKNLFAKTRVVSAVKVIFENQNPKLHKPKKISKKVKETYVENLQEYKEALDITCVEVNENEECGEGEQIWAVRSKYGDYPVKFYKTTAGDDIEIRYVVRYQYAIDVMCSYFDVREIPYEDWFMLDDEHKIKTVF